MIIIILILIIIIIIVHLLYKYEVIHLFVSGIHTLGLLLNDYTIMAMIPLLIVTIIVTIIVVITVMGILSVDTW